MKDWKFLRLHLLLVLFLLSAFAFSQTAAEMDDLLGADTVNAASAARFVLGAADLLPAGVSGAGAENTAYEMARSKGWIKAAAGEAITLKDAAFLIMKAFDLQGGVMYSLFKNHRYAYREMVYRKIIPGSINQNKKVSGSALLQILDSTVSYIGGGIQ